MTDKKADSVNRITAASMQAVKVGNKPTYKVDYKLGIMINFVVSEEALTPYVPLPLKPWALKLLQTDDKPKFYVSLYLAVCFMNDAPPDTTRADVFTYVLDKDGKPGLSFLGVLVDIPNGMPEKYVGKYLKMQEGFFVDSHTGKPTVPHQRVDKLIMSHQNVDLTVGKTIFKTMPNFRSVANTPTLFHNDFVIANSMIYHNGHDRTVNFFNQDFISAPVTDIDLACIHVSDPNGFHPLCEKLESVQVYGNASQPIPWFFQARL